MSSAPHDQPLNIRLTKAEKDRLLEDASLAGLSVSEVARRRVFGRPIVPKTDLVVIRELRRLGGLIKHHASAGSRLETTKALAALTHYIERLSHDR